MSEETTYSESLKNKLNQKRRYTIQYAVGDFVLIHRASKLHISKSKFVFLGPYEIMIILKENRYELKWVGAYIKNY